MSLRSLAARAFAAAFFASLTGASCGQVTLGLMPGVLNDPHNLSLRKALMAYGTNRICEEVQKRSVGLRLRDDDPIMGRFFPGTCFLSEYPNKDLGLQFSGTGYVWSNLTHRMSFEAAGTIEYDTDFLMDGSTMYVYFRQRGTNAARFTTRLVEQPTAAVVAGLPLGRASQNFAGAFGAQIMQSHIARGFTVIREASGATQVALGVVEPGTRPPAPYRSDDQGHAVVANERSEVHQNQRDFVGPIEVPEGQKLDLSVSIDGAPGIDVIVLPRGAGEAWLQTYTTQASTTPPPAMPLLDEPVVAGAPWRRSLSLPAGVYYVVLDNTPTAGRTAPTTYARDDRAALVSYALALD